MNEKKAPAIVILSEHFYPSTGATAQLITDLADSLSQSGVNLCVVTSTPGPDTSDYSIIRLSATLNKSASIFTKALSGLTFFIRSTYWILANVSRNERILLVSNPPFICVTGLLVKLFKGVDFAFLFQDVFPRSAILAGILPSRGLLVQFWKYIFHLSIKLSFSTIVLSYAMKKRCALEFKNTHKYVVIPNWSILPTISSSELTTADVNESTSPLELSNPLKVQYSGNFGRLHDLITILECSRLVSPSKAQFEFVGGGAKRDQITTYQRHYKLSNVIIRDYVPRSQLRSSIGGCDISIISLTSGAEDTVAPSKLYGVLALGKPIILIASPTSTIAKFIRQNHCGIVVAPGDPVALANQIEHIHANPSLIIAMSKASKLLSSTLSSCQTSSAAYLSLLEQDFHDHKYFRSAASHLTLDANHLNHF